MNGLLIRTSLALIILFGVAPKAVAQRPDPQQAQRLLSSRPDLVRQLRDRILQSGMTADQVRARLRAEGYPDTLLDAYLPGDSLSTDTIPTRNTLNAIRSLGIADSVDVTELERQLNDRQNEQVAPVERKDLAREFERRPKVAPYRDPLAVPTLPLPKTRADSLKADSVFADSMRAALDLRDRPVVFGLDMFQRPTTLFEANLAGPVDEDYRLGPGDQLVLILTGDVEQAHTLDVTREGTIVIPQVGQIAVNNLTLSELNELLYARLGRVYSGVVRGPNARTRFSVSVAKLRSNQVFVTGDVSQPGSYRVSSAGTALTALYAAGGPTANGSMRRVTVRRGSRAADTLDVYDYLLKGEASHDGRLQAGDIVFIPVHGPRVQLTGEVVRPAVYELVPGETLADAVRMAGGFSPNAARRRVQVERITPPAQRTAGGRDRYLLDVTASSTDGDAPPPVPLEAGDVIRVFRIDDRVRDRIRVDGNVWLPGDQAFRTGMTLSEALKRAGGAKSDTYLGRVLVSRLQPDSTRSQLSAMLSDTTGAVVQDIPLQEDDEVRVFSVTEFRPERYVAISGAVRHGGQFPYRSGMTIRDLVLLAGGLEQSAYLESAEIARLPTDRSHGVTAVTTRIPLDSSYLFERGPDGRYLGPPGLPAPSGPTPDVTLSPYDNVLILNQPNWHLQRAVTLTGEVAFPGTYTLVRKSERLTDLLSRAGGLTTESYSAGIAYYRRRDVIRRIGIDLPKVLKDPQFRDNLLLEDGDSIHVPRYNPVVAVTGSVNASVSVAYQPGRKIDYYVARAGGANRLGDAKHAYVTQPNGSVESRTRRMLLFSYLPEPRPGSTVAVPAKDPNDHKDYAAIVGSVASVLASLVAILAIAKR
ncbi:MAG: SLBB domain-containing protein [Gemmatimonadaceae bacterium]